MADIKKIKVGSTTYDIDADKLDGKHASEFQQIYKYGETSSTTKIKININSTLSWMLCFTVTLYQGYRATKVMISGYNYGASHWYQPEARLIADSDNTETINVYFGYDATNKLWVGFDGGNYTGVSIDDVTNGYTQIDDFSNLFTITNVTSLATLQSTVTAASRANYANSAGNADTVDSKHASDFLSAATNYTSKIKIGTSTTEYAPSSGVITLPAYPTVPTIPNEYGKIQVGSTTTTASTTQSTIEFSKTGDLTVAINGNKITYGYTTPASLPANGGSAAYAEAATQAEYLMGSYTAGIGGTLVHQSGNVDVFWIDQYNAHIGTLSNNATIDMDDTNSILSLSASGGIVVNGSTLGTAAFYASTAFASAVHYHSGVYQPAGTYYAGNLAISTTIATDKSLTLNQMNASYMYAQSVFLGVNGSFWDTIYVDTMDEDGIHITQYSSTGRYLSIDYSYIMLGTNISGSTYMYDARAHYLSVNGKGHTYISNNFISIYASSYNNTNEYNAILLSANATNAKISLYAPYIGIQAGDGTSNGNIYASTYSANLKIKNTYLEGQYFIVSTTGNLYISGPSTTGYVMVSGYYTYLTGSSYTHILGTGHVLLSTTNTGDNNYVAIQRGGYASRPAVAGWQHNIRLWLSGKVYARFQLYSGTSTAITTMAAMATMLNACKHSTADTAVMATGRGTSSAGYVVNGIYATGNYNSSVYLTCAAYASGLTSALYGGNNISTAAVTDYVKVVQS